MACPCPAWGGVEKPQNHLKRLLTASVHGLLDELASRFRVARGEDGA